MKLALARIMLQKVNIFLMNEPTSHPDAIHVIRAKKYLNSLTDIMTVIVFYDSVLLNDCCTNTLSIPNLKLVTFKGNLNKLVNRGPPPLVPLPMMCRC